MDVVRIHVTHSGQGYLAESRNPDIRAVGTSAEEAAENARLQAMEMLRPNDSSRRMLIVRVTETGRESIAMQALKSGFSLRAQISDCS